MFFQIIFALYILLNIYLYLRLRKFFSRGWQRILYAFGYLFLVLAFPMAEIVEHRAHSLWWQPVLWIGFLSLPYQLYLFLTSLLLDSLWGVNRLLKRLPPSQRYQNPLRKKQIWILLLLPAVVVLAGHLNLYHLSVQRYHIQIPRKESARSHLRLAVASDFHLHDMTASSFVHRFVDRINALEVDALLIPGDMLEGDGNTPRLQAWQRQFCDLKTTFGVYATLGNHDTHGRRIRTDFFDAARITLLQDTVVVIDNAFALAGRNDNRVRNRKTMASLLPTPRPRLPLIVMDHRPTDLEAICAAGADLAVSGHTHYGQLFPFNFIVDALYELSWGYKKFNDTHVFVTCGIQVWGPPVRTAGVSEIMVIDVDLMQENE